MTKMLNTGDISRALGCTLPREFIENTLGVPADSHDKAARLFNEASVATIYTRIAERCTQLASDVQEGLLDVPPKPVPAEKAPAGSKPGAKSNTPPVDDDEL